jgi:plastocyanin
MPIRWNEEEMTPLDVLHKKLQMQFTWSDYFINKGDTVMFNKCQNDINNIRIVIKQIKEKQQQKYNNKNQKQFKNKFKS